MRDCAARRIAEVTRLAESAGLSLPKLKAVKWIWKHRDLTKRINECRDAVMAAALKNGESGGEETRLWAAGPDGELPTADSIN